MAGTSVDKSPVSGIILAGGRSSRLGSDKALLRLGHQRPLIEEIAFKLSQIAQEVIVVASSRDTYPGLSAAVVGDIYPHKGSLGGIYSGLLAAKHQHALVVACDMPFLNVGLLKYMVSLPRHYDVLIPRVAGNLEPLHAIYSKRCLASIKDLLDNSQLQIFQFFPQVKVCYLDEAEVDRFDPQRLSFFNINTPEELARARVILGA